MELKRSLGFWDAFALVVGTIIGTGIFIKAASMAQSLGSYQVVMWAWIVAGLLSFLGALTYSELGSLFPKAGGEYIYLKEGYGNLTSFLYGWTRFWIASPGSIAAYAVGSATFLQGGFGQVDPQKNLFLALGFIAFFTLLNLLAVSVGGFVQKLLTLLKFVLLLGIAFGIFFISPHQDTSLAETGQPFNWSLFGAALISALWAYDGWNNLPMAAGEVENPQKNLPRALLLGLLAILGLYLLVNHSYFLALPMGEILTSKSKEFSDALPVGIKAAQTFLGESGLAILAIGLVISALGAMNGSMLTGSRVPFAMAREGQFIKKLGELNRNSVPFVSVLVQGVIASVLAMSGSFDQLTDYVVFASWIFYGLCGFAVIRLRKLKPNMERSFKVPLFPFIPILFVVLSGLLLINTLITSPKESLMGLLIIALGVPFYLYRNRIDKVHKS